MKNNKELNRGKGFTVVELLIVIVIIGIMTSIAVQNLLSYRPKSRLNGAARTVVADLMAARMAAVKRKCKVIVNFETTGASAGREYWIVIDENRNNAYDSGETKIVKSLVGEYPDVKNIKADTKNIFNSRGASSRMRNIILQNGSGQRTIRVSIAGRIKIE